MAVVVSLYSDAPVRPAWRPVIYVHLPAVYATTFRASGGRISETQAPAA